MDDIRAHGGEPIVWRTGHSFIKMKMREAGVPSGRRAERSHLLRGELLRGRRALRGVQAADVPGGERTSRCRQHFEGIQKWATSPEYRVPCADDKKWDVVEAVAAELREKYPSVEIDGIRATFPEGWALVRASNTGPNLTLRFEARTQAALDAISDEVLGLLRLHVDVPDAPSAGH